MPEMTFEVRWPDGAVDRCYSPSLVMHDHLQTGATYTVADFTQRATTALTEASDRVRARYGFACTAAAATTRQILSRASDHSADATVDILSMRPSP